MKLNFFLVSILEKYGINKKDANNIVEVYLTAERYGLKSHGVMRFKRLIEGINSYELKDNSEIEKDYGSSALIDGKGYLGIPLAIKAMNLAIEKAKENGIGCVGLKNSSHFGIAGYYSEIAANENCIGITVCNTQPSIAAFGGKKKVLGTNPIAIGVPTKEGPMVLDLSVSSVTKGKVLECLRTGEKLPEGCAVDKEGKMTTDPEEALNGAFLPYGGNQSYKTFGLALMIDILAGPLVGANFGTKVTGTSNTKEKCTKGDLFIAIDVSKFRDVSEFLGDIEELKKMVKESGDNVYLPGEIERSREKIEIDKEMMEELIKIGKSVNIDF